MPFVPIWRVFSLPSHKGCERLLHPDLEIRNLLNLVLKDRALKVNGPRVKVRYRKHARFRVIGDQVRAKAIARVIARDRDIARAKAITRVITKDITKVIIRVKGVSQIQRQMPLILAALQLSPPRPIYAIRASLRQREISMIRF
jgi:hypothetical protein